ALGGRRDLQKETLPRRPRGPVRVARAPRPRVWALHRRSERDHRGGPRLLRLSLYRTLRGHLAGLLVRVPDDRRSVLQRALPDAWFRRHRVDPRPVRRLPDLAVGYGRLKSQRFAPIDASGSAVFSTSATKRRVPGTTA